MLMTICKLRSQYQPRNKLCNILTCSSSTTSAIHPADVTLLFAVLGVLVVAVIVIFGLWSLCQALQHLQKTTQLLAAGVERLHAQQVRSSTLNVWVLCVMLSWFVLSKCLVLLCQLLA